MSEIITADVLEWCKTYDGPKFHAILCDPPYELGFMGKDWDKTGIVFDPDTWAALAEHLHPGGFGMAFASSRGWHRLACAIEDAGLRIHPSIFGWAFGSGFPKATRIDTQIDKAAGRAGIKVEALKRRLIELFDASGKTRSQIDSECGFRACNYLTLPKDGKRPDPWVGILPTQEKWNVIRRVIGCGNADFESQLDQWFAEAEREVIGQQTKARKTDQGIALPCGGDTEYQTWDLTAPATSLAKAWAGHRYGLQAMKPALEPVIVFQVPYEGKPVESIVETGAGALNIDASRIPTEDKLGGGDQSPDVKTATDGWDRPWMRDPGMKEAHAQRINESVVKSETLGRWPANFYISPSRRTYKLKENVPLEKIDEIYRWLHEES